MVGTDLILAGTLECISAYLSVQDVPSKPTPLDDLVLELLVAALLRRRERTVAQLVLDVLVLQAAQPLMGIGDLVEGLDHLGLELGLDRGSEPGSSYSVQWCILSNVRAMARTSFPTFVQLPALVKARQGATDGDRSSYLDGPSIKPNLGADAEY
jgi:hypothetical protein